jgi:hypothetical protein
MMAYESGSLCSNNPQAFVTHPDMYDLIYELYSVLSEYFTVVNPFCHVGTWEYSKAWVGQPESEANVYRAIKDWTSSNPVSVAGRRAAPVPGLSPRNASHAYTVVRRTPTSAAGSLFGLDGRRAIAGLRRLSEGCYVVLSQDAVLP